MLLSLLLLDPYDDEEGNSLSLQLSVLLATPVCSLKRFVDPPVVFPELLVKATTTLLATVPEERRVKVERDPAVALIITTRIESEIFFGKDVGK